MKRKIRLILSCYTSQFSCITAVPCNKPGYNRRLPFAEYEVGFTHKKDSSGMEERLQIFDLRAASVASTWQPGLQVPGCAALCSLPLLYTSPFPRYSLRDGIVRERYKKSLTYLEVCCPFFYARLFFAYIVFSGDTTALVPAL